MASGEETVSAIVDQLSVIEDESVSDVPLNEVYVVDRSPIILFASWTSIEDEEMGKKEFVATILSEEDW